MSEMAIDQVKRMARQLSQTERAQLATWLESTLEAGESTPVPASTRSLYGLWADLGPGPLDVDIDEARREMWRSFPREDIA